MNNIELFNDHFQNFKSYGIPRAQLIIADVPYCYDTETECWTRNGWKRYDEITLDDEVLSLDHQTQEMQYSGIERIIIRDNDEDMISFDSRNINLLVSANHRCYAINDFKPNLKFGKRLRERKRLNTENIRLAKDATAASYIPRSGYVWRGGMSVERVTIPPCKIGLNANKTVLAPAVIIPLDDWLRFFGLWLADGCTTRGGSSGYYVSIKQLGENRAKVRDILSALPFDFKEHQEKNRVASNFNIYSKQLYTFLLPFGKSADKYIPRWILDLPAEKLRILWEAYTFGDSTKNGKGLKISSVSPRLIEGLQEVALKIGVICHIRHQSNPAWGKTELHYFQFNGGSKNIAYHNKKVVSDYKGKVWCLTLKTNSVFLVRRKGLITFSGNCIGNKAYASNPAWYVDGDNSKGESDLAGKQFFDTDKNFRPAEFMHFCSQMLRKDKPVKVEKTEQQGKSKGNAACMILFCPFEQMHYYIELGHRYGLKRYIPLVFRKDFSAQVLKANMKVVGNCEYGLILYRDRLPKFNNDGRMIFNCFDWVRDTETPKIHPTQKPVPLLERLIEIFTDKGDVVIDPCAGSGTTLLAAANMGRKAYGFEIKKNFYAAARSKVLTRVQKSLFV